MRINLRCDGPGVLIRSAKKYINAWIILLTIGKRSFTKIATALLQARHWYAVKNALLSTKEPVAFLMRYLTCRGNYPKTFAINCKGKTLAIDTYSHDDLLTINEIFFRHDYRVCGDESCIVDFGSNIGISLLYFLSCAPRAHVYAYEPVPINFSRLKANLAHNELDRAQLHQSAISDTPGIASFGVEPTGRYGGIGLDFRETIAVNCLEINAVLEKILAQEGMIDILKIDTEGNENILLRAIDPKFYGKIKKIYVESNHSVDLPGHTMSKRGQIFAYTPSIKD